MGAKTIEDGDMWWTNIPISDFVFGKRYDNTFLDMLGIKMPFALLADKTNMTGEPDPNLFCQEKTGKNNPLEMRELLTYLGLSTVPSCGVNYGMSASLICYNHSEPVTGRAPGQITPG